MTMLRCVRITGDREPEDVMVEDSLKGFKGAIGLTEDDDLGGVLVRIRDVAYILYHDDRGRLKELAATVLDPFGRPYLVGPVLVTKFDGVDGEVSMTEADVSSIMGRTFAVPAKGIWGILLEAGA